MADSMIKGAGQGLFAKTYVETDTVMAFYNGVRITHSEVRHTANVQKKMRALIPNYGWAYCPLHGGLLWGLEENNLE